MGRVRDFVLRCGRRATGARAEIARGSVAAASHASTTTTPVVRRAPAKRRAHRTGTSRSSPVALRYERDQHGERWRRAMVGAMQDSREAELGAYLADRMTMRFKSLRVVLARGFGAANQRLGARARL